MMDRTLNRIERAVLIVFVVLMLTIVGLIPVFVGVIPLYAAMSNDAALKKAISLWGPQADMAQRYNPRRFEVGVKSPQCALPFTVLGSGPTSWESAFANVKPVYIAGPYKGKVNLTSEWSDYKGAVTGVQYSMDGQSFTEIVAEPPSVEWIAVWTLDTSLLADGIHVVCARGRDAAGNTGGAKALLIRTQQ